MATLQIIAGLAFLVAGGEILVRSAAALGLWARLSPILVGMTIVGFGTSTPELIVSAQAAFQGQPDIAVANVVGSNIVNILLILGLAAVIRPIQSSPVVLWRDSLVVLFVSLLLVVVSLAGEVSRILGGIFLTGLIAYLVFAYRMEVNARPAHGGIPFENVPEMPDRPQHPAVSAGLVVIGLILLMAGSNWLVSGATVLALQLAIPEVVIGLTLIAVGTSLPELATSAIAAFRGQSEIALGNVLGSNIFNILGILGGTALITPLPIAPSFLYVDVWVMAGSVILVIPFLWTGRIITRLEGGLFLLLYVVYTLFLFISIP